MIKSWLKVQVKLSILVLRRQLLNKCLQVDLKLSDIYGIAKSGLQAYKEGLATTGQNIANVK